MAIGTAWADGAWIDAGWVVEAWDQTVSPPVSPPVIPPPSGGGGGGGGRYGRFGKTWYKDEKPPWKEEPDYTEQILLEDQQILDFIVNLVTKGHSE